jgi:L-aspartate oxidase
MNMRFTLKPYIYDLIVVGSGVAGMYAAIKAARFAKVCMITKDRLRECNTYMAQGGIAAALGEHDSAQKHFQDTLLAGYGNCDAEAVRIMTEDAPLIIEQLAALGMLFCTEQGSLSMRREGAHTENRIVYADGDATGRVLHDTLSKKLIEEKSVDIWENTFVTHILADDSRVFGIRTLSGETFLASCVLIATGGAGQAFSCNTNSKTATGDGIAMAFEAGVKIIDMEFMQFHPTAFKISENEYLLITEALRGEGALLRNSKGKRFMPEYHDMAEMAPRDVVSRAILDQIKKYGCDSVYLDITFKNKKFLRAYFPTIYKKTLECGYDLAKDLLPVIPAAHYMIGGIETGVWGETSLDGLYACGEAACTGAHGANRLASNSLLESLVFANRAADHIERTSRQSLTRFTSEDFEKENMKIINGSGSDSDTLNKLRALMFKNAGIYRDEQGLLKTKKFIMDNKAMLQAGLTSRHSYEFKNLLITSELMVDSALLRTESRGCHYRADYPKENDAWRNRRIRSTDLGYHCAKMLRA